jgi:uncharacterized protein YgbK (DUF1537 family)
VVILDDDPTGTQTVRDTVVLTSWGEAELARELAEPSRGFYILTNSRAFAENAAWRINREIAQVIRRVAGKLGVAVTYVSRGDSTLRGHFPAELEALVEGQGTAPDINFLIPAFFAGGRITCNDTHWVVQGDEAIPVGKTEFARDPAFAFASSYLPDYIIEKSGGKIARDIIFSVAVEELRSVEVDKIAERLALLPLGAWVIVNAVCREDIDVFSHVVAAPVLARRHLLFRSAADFAAACLGQPAHRPLSSPELKALRGEGGGLIVAGSFVGKTTRQLEALWAAAPEICRVELQVDRILDPETSPVELNRVRQDVNDALREGRTVCCYTSRQLVQANEARKSLALGARVSEAVIAVVNSLETRPAWLVAKGGITSSDIATKGLGVQRAMVPGQALPGVPLWRCGDETKWPGLAYIVFPGNVGGENALVELYEKLR